MQETNKTKVRLAKIIPNQFKDLLINIDEDEAYVIGRNKAEWMVFHINVLQQIIDDNISKAKIREVIANLGVTNLTSGNASEDHKLLRTGYAAALKDLRKKLELNL